MKIIPFLFNLLVFLLPLVFFPKTSELFEFNKIITIYIFTILISSAWAWESFKNKKFLLKSTPLSAPILMFLLSQALATIVSIDQRTSLLGYYGRFHGGLVSYICYSILYFAFVTFMDKGKTLKLLNTLLISVGVAAIYAASEHFGKSPSCLIITGNFDTACWVQNVQERVFGTFGQPNWLAAYLVAVIPLTWVATISNSQFSIFNKIPKIKTKSILFLLLFALLFTTLLFTKSRSGLLGFGFAFAVFWLPNIKKHFSVFALTTCYVLFSIIFIWNPFTGTKPPVEGVTESSDIRKIVWQGAFDLWKKYPLLGTGVETFAYSYYETRPVEHNLTSEWNFIYNKAHNEYLNFLATTGIVGLASYLVLIIASLRTLRNNLPLLAGYISILVTNFFGFSTVTIALLFFLFPAMAISLVNTQKLLTRKNKNKAFLAFLFLITGYLLLAPARYWLADYFYAQKDYKKAVTLSPNEPTFKAEIVDPLGLLLTEEMAPRNIKLIKTVAGSYSMLGETDKKYYFEENRVLLNLTKYAPTDASLFYDLALSYGKIGNIPAAKKSLEKALLLKPNYIEARRLLDHLSY